MEQVRSTNLSDYKEALFYCLQCGLCQGDCPSFRALRKSTATARGHVNLLMDILEGNQELSPRVAELLEECLVCGGCTNVCPSGIKGDDITVMARKLVMDRYGLPWKKRAALWALGNLRRTGALLRLASPFKALAFKHLGDANQSVSPRSFLQSVVPYHAIPDFGGPCFIDRYAGRHQPSGKRRGSLAYFVGCLTNLVYQRVGEQVVKTLVDLGYEVWVPADQGCCGLPSLVSGDLEAARRQYLSNLRALTAVSVDGIITDCTSCWHMLHEKGPWLLEGQEGQASVGSAFQARAVSPKAGNGEGPGWLGPKVWEIMNFLEETGNWDRLEARSHGRTPLKLSYHVPCHAKGSTGVKEAPREFFKRKEGFEYRELDMAEKCCGSGGSFAFFHYDIADRIRQEKIDDIRATGPQVVVSGCPACRMQLADGLAKENLPMRMAHPLELLEVKPEA